MTIIDADKMSNAQYHATDAISSSAVKAVHGKSLAHWKARGEFKGSTTFDIASEAPQIVVATHGKTHTPKRRPMAKRC